MEDKQLKNKAIDIKGKQYVLVADRINYFNENYPNGSIQTVLVSSTDSTYVIKSIIIPDVDKPERLFTGYSQAKIGQGMVNTTAALENCETSAVGRALAMMGIGVIDSVASIDEIKKAEPVYETVPEKHEFNDSKCVHCGAPITISKSTGKPYCSAKCWLPK